MPDSVLSLPGALPYIFRRLLMKAGQSESDEKDNTTALLNCSAYKQLVSSQTPPLRHVISAEVY
jgi:hypothetical protein